MSQALIVRHGYIIYNMCTSVYVSSTHGYITCVPQCMSQALIVRHGFIPCFRSDHNFRQVKPSDPESTSTDNNGARPGNTFQAKSGQGSGLRA